MSESGEAMSTGRPRKIQAAVDYDLVEELGPDRTVLNKVYGSGPDLALQRIAKQKGSPVLVRDELVSGWIPIQTPVAGYGLYSGFELNS